MLLEPLEMDIAALTERLRNAKITAKQRKTGVTLMDFAPFEAIKKREQLADRILLATQCMVDSKQKHGKALIDRFSLIVDLHKTCSVDGERITLPRAQSHFEFARYAESLYHEARAKEEQEEQSNFSGNTAGGKGSSASTASGKRGSGGSKRGRGKDDNNDQNGDIPNVDAVREIDHLPYLELPHLQCLLTLTIHHHLQFSPINTPF